MGGLRLGQLGLGACVSYIANQPTNQTTSCCFEMAGATYPVHKLDVEQFYSEHDEGTGVTASMKGEEPAPATHQRAMLSTDDDSTVTAGLLGRKPKALPA